MNGTRDVIVLSSYIHNLLTWKARDRSKISCKTRTFGSWFRLAFDNSDRFLIGSLFITYVRLVGPYYMHGGYVYHNVHEMTCGVGEHNPCYWLCQVCTCWGGRIWVRIAVWLGPWSHLSITLSPFGLFIICIGNLRCVSYFTLVVHWFKFVLILFVSRF